MSEPKSFYFSDLEEIVVLRHEVSIKFLESYYSTWKYQQETAEKLGIPVDVTHNDPWIEAEILLASIDRHFFRERKSGSDQRLSAKSRVILSLGISLDFTDHEKRPLVENFLSDWCLTRGGVPYEEAVKLSRMSPYEIERLTRNSVASSNLAI